MEGSFLLILQLGKASCRAAITARVNLVSLTSRVFRFLQSLRGDRSDTFVLWQFRFVRGNPFNGDKSDIPALKKAAQAETKPLERSFAEHALAHLGEPDGHAALLKNLQSKDETIRGLAAETAGYTATRHQREVGTGYFDMVTSAINPQSSTTALAGSTESEQFATAAH